MRFNFSDMDKLDYYEDEYESCPICGRKYNVDTEDWCAHIAVSHLGGLNMLEFNILNTHIEEAKNGGEKEKKKLAEIEEKLWVNEWDDYSKWKRYVEERWCKN